PRSSPASGTPSTPRGPDGPRPVTHWSQGGARSVGNARPGSTALLDADRRRGSTGGFVLGLGLRLGGKRRFDLAFEATQQALHEEGPLTRVVPTIAVARLDVVELLVGVADDLLVRLHAPHDFFLV